MMSLPKCPFVLTALMFSFLLPSLASAQSPTLTTTSAVVPAGPDYRTDLLANPWDFSDAVDTSPWPTEYFGWTTSETTVRTLGRGAFLSGGQFVGRTADPTASIPLLYRGSRAWMDSRTEPATGDFDEQAIPTARYGKLSFALTLNNVPANAELFVSWFGSRYVEPSQAGRALVVPARSGTHLYSLDLQAGTYLDDRGIARAGRFGPIASTWTEIPWNDAPLMRGLHIRPAGAGTGVDVALDWVRLTTRDVAAPGVPVTFSGCSGREYSIEVLIGNQWEVIDAAIAAAAPTTTAHVNYGVLPPGTWTLRVACFPGSRTGAGPIVSQNTMTLEVNQPPLVTVLDPDAAGGSDFATTVLGNPWDWNALSDAPQIHGVAASSIVFDGVSNTLQATSPPGTRDPAVVFVFGNPQIDTSRYRNLTFSLTLDTPFGLSGPGEGSVARVFWERASATGGNLVTTSQAFIVWPGRNTYSIDLSTLSLANGRLETECLPGCAQVEWAASPVRYFRIDPHENANGITFRLGPVLLTAPDEAVFGRPFAIQYAFTDSDTAGSNYTARISLDVNRDYSGVIPLATIPNVTPNTLLSYSFEPASTGIGQGEYFVLVEITEQRGGVSDTRARYSTGPLRVRSAAGTGAPDPPTLRVVQTAQNPVVLAWTASGGGAPTSYTIQAGTAPGVTNLASFDLGLQTSISANAPAGFRIYVRVVATNAAGSSTSNEISFILAPPPAPSLGSPVVTGQTVTLNWSAVNGATGYVVVARYPGNPAVIAILPTGGTSLTVPNVPPGTYAVSVVGTNAFGIGAESNTVLVTVP